MHISYININYKRFAGDCFEMNSSAVAAEPALFVVILLGESEYIFASFPENGTLRRLSRPFCCKQSSFLCGYTAAITSAASTAPTAIYTRLSRARLTESICIISSCSMTAKRSNIPGYIMICRASI